jgi:uncharacterized membrane protein
MESRAKLFGHPVHPMLIVYPLGLLSTAVIFDGVYWMSSNSQWAIISYWLIAGGILGGLAAAVFGTIDWLAIPPGTRAKRIGALHGIGNVVVLGLFALSWYLRSDDPLTPEPGALASSFCGVLLSVFTGWLGGELVGRLGVGVADGANVNAPSSLKAHSPSAR